MSNNIWSIVPNTSVNKLTFGMNRSTVQKMLGVPSGVFKKSAYSANTTDDYSDFHVYYTAGDQLEAIELFNRKISVFINSQIVFPGKLCDIQKIIPDLEECFGSYISKDASIGISEEDGNIASILIGCKDYYNRD